MFDETNTTYETRYNLLAALTQEHFSDTLHTCNTVTIVDCFAETPENDISINFSDWDMVNNLSKLDLICKTLGLNKPLVFHTEILTIQSDYRHSDLYRSVHNFDISEVLRRQLVYRIRFCSYVYAAIPVSDLLLTEVDCRDIDKVFNFVMLLDSLDFLERALIVIMNIEQIVKHLPSNITPYGILRYFNVSL